MYATVRSYTVAPGLAEGLEERASEVTRVIGSIDGFRAYYLIRTAEGAVSVSVYDTQAGAEESAKAAAAFLRESLPDLQVGAPDVVSGEVVVNA